MDAGADGDAGALTGGDAGGTADAGGLDGVANGAGILRLRLNAPAV